LQDLEPRDTGMMFPSPLVTKYTESARGKFNTAQVVCSIGRS